MRKCLGVLILFFVCLALLLMEISRLPRPGSFAWVYRTEIWFYIQGTRNVGFDVGVDGTDNSGWIIELVDKEDISFLTNKIRVVSLELSGSKHVDLFPIAAQTNLRELVVRNCAVQDISPLADLQQLWFLDLSGTSISDITALKNLDNLCHLDISNTKIKDISPLSGLRSLQILSISCSEVTNLLPLANLDGLTELYIDGIPCRDFSGIPFNNLEFLKLTAQGTNSWKNTSLLRDNFHGRLFFSYYPHSEIDAGYSFYSSEYALKHFDENNGTDNPVAFPPEEPNVPFTITPVDALATP